MFDQELHLPDDRHVLEVDEHEIPRRYAPVLRRLEGAAASEEVSDSMALEDEVSETWGRMKQEIAEQTAALADKDATLERERSERAVAEQRIAELERERAAERAAAEERIAELERRLAESGDDD